MSESIDCVILLCLYSVGVMSFMMGLWVVLRIFENGKMYLNKHKKNKYISATYQ